MNNGKYYTGSTDNIKRRFADHQAGNTPSTKPHRPLELLACKTYDSLQEARKFERHLKTLKNRQKIEEFVIMHKVDMSR